MNTPSLQQTVLSRPNVTVLIPAAGVGERLGLGPKALLNLAGKPLLSWVARKVLQLSRDVLVTAPPGQVEAFSSLCPGCRCIEGGATRQHSVELLLNEAQSDWVIIADVVRPFGSLALYVSVLEAASETGAAGAFLLPDVPVAHIVDNRVKRDFRRDEVGVFQAPQAFSRSLLLRVYAAAREQGWQEQSTLQLALRAGIEVAAVAGEKNNIKLTTPEDWRIAQLYTEYLD